MAVAAKEPLSAADLLSVKSRISWGAISAGAMVALTIYVVLMLLGVTVGIEVAVRGTDFNLGVGSALYTVLALAIAMFFGGWTASRLAVGEDRVEAILYAIVLWGVLFLGLIFLVASGMRTGFSAMMGVAWGSYSVSDDGARAGLDVDRIASDMKAAGVEEAQTEKFVSYLEQARQSPVSAVQRAADDPEARQAATEFVEASRTATRWTLSGIVVSLLLVIMGALIGAGEVPMPVPIGVIRPRRV